MSTSNTTSYNQTRDQIISDALQTIGRLGDDQTPSVNDITFCSGMLNKLLKSWEALGIHLWAYSFGTVFLRNGVGMYTLGSGGDQACDDSTLVETTLTSSGSGTSLALLTTVGMTMGDNIGICLDDNTTQWTTIASVDSLTGVTLNTGITGTASANNNVYSYTNNMGKVLKIIGASSRLQTGAEVQCKILGRTQYQQISQKTVQSNAPNEIFYSPNINSGELFFWPIPNVVTTRLKISYLRALQDFDESTDNPDLPQEWLDALTMNLARRIAPAYGVDLSKVTSDIVNMAKESLGMLQLWDSEMGSVNIRPEEDTY